MDNINHIIIDEQLPQEFLANIDDEDGQPESSWSQQLHLQQSTNQIDSNNSGGMLPEFDKDELAPLLVVNQLDVSTNFLMNNNRNEPKEVQTVVDTIADDKDCDDRESSIQPHKRRKPIKNVEYFAKKNINRYLKRRGFTTLKETSSPTLSLEKLVDNMKNVFNSQNGINSVSCGANYEAKDIVDEIERFWKFYQWMKNEDVTASLQLRPMIIPILIYFYIECLLSGVVNQAAQIFATFSHKFYDEDQSQEDYNVLTTLANISCESNFQSSSLKNNPVIKQLKDRPYEFRVNAWVFEKIQKFIQLSQLPVMVNLLTQRFIIQIEDSDAIADFNFGPEQTTEEATVGSANNSDNVDVTKIRVQSAIEKLRGSTLANMPSIQVYTTNGKAVCGAVSKVGSMVAFGMADAGIRIFEASPVDGGFDAKIPAEDIGPDNRVKLMSGHNGLVNDLGFHPRAKYIFSVGEDASMRIWDAHNNICRAIYRGHHCPIWSLDISGTGNLIVTGSMDTTARIWVPERTDFVRLLVGHYFDVDCVKFHPNEAYVATGSVDKSVRLWSVSDGNLVRMFTGSKGAINSIAFHENGKYIASAGEDSKIRIMDLGEGKVITELEGAENCRDISFYKDMLAAAYSDQKIRLWNVRDLLANSSLPNSTNSRGDDEAGDESTHNPIKPEIVPSKTESIVKLYYKNLSKLYCLASTK